MACGRVILTAHDRPRPWRGSLLVGKPRGAAHLSPQAKSTLPRLRAALVRSHRPHRSDSFRPARLRRGAEIYSLQHLQQKKDYC